ncbi:A1pp-domain-containing protein [Mycena venus]|uniref:A1pp-domain-containing protein n=1 Tax=Mycena venus TaxID=2733690 RepID=A0A8H7CLL0_9AGAR|nr:A1pp-domain-containing protein [Mycena venus]
MSVLSLPEYRNLIDLSPPAGLNDQTATSQDLDVAYGIALDYLDPDDALAHMDQDTVVRALLTVRDPAEGPLPDTVLRAVDIILAAKLTGSTLTAVDSIPALTNLFPSPSVPLPPLLLPHLVLPRGHHTDILAPAGDCQCMQLGAPGMLQTELRADCYTIMQAQGGQEPDGYAKVTKAWSLPCGYVLHTVGPQLNRGSAPSKEEEEALSGCYTSCLDLADELGTIDAVAFPCISTGLFAFPGDVAARLALRAVDGWLAAHPTTNMRVVFTLFLPADVENYTQALSAVFPAIVAQTSKKIRPLLPPGVVDAIKNADAIMIRAGAGLSVDAVHKELGLGLDYTSPTVFSTLYPGLVKSTKMRCLYDTFGNDFPDANTALAFRLLHAHTILNWGPTPVYAALHKLVHTVANKDYFVVTSNADRLFFQSGFDPARIYTPQGGYALLQCMQPCSPHAYFPIQPFIDRALPHLDRATVRFPDDVFEEVRPHCPRCGSVDVFLNVRAAGWFLETPQAGERAAYEGFIARCVRDGKRLLLLELGAGFNTPSVIRWPGERMAKDGGGEGDAGPGEWQDT